MFCWVVIDKYLSLSKVKSQCNITSDITSFSWQEDKDYFVFRNHRKQSLAICAGPMKALCSHKSSPWWSKFKLLIYLQLLFAEIEIQLQIFHQPSTDYQNQTKLLPLVFPKLLF